MTQTLAILLDAYRSLNSKWLFWIVLGLSGIVVLAFACFGLNEHGYKFLVWQFDDPMWNSRSIPPELFYKTIFKRYGIKTWFSFGATILALISTAGIFPDLLTQGSIDVFISRPISRLRLFLTQYIAGLLFVALQIFVFTFASFFVMGLRGGAWIPALYFAVPLVVCFYSYLFSVCVLFGVWTRSTMLSFLMAILFWAFVFVIDISEQALFKIVAANKQGISIIEPDSLAGPSNRKATAKSDESKSVGYDWWNGLHRVAYGLKTVLPKTGETLALLDRQLMEVDEITIDHDPTARGRNSGRETFELQTEKQILQRPVSWVVGTSLGFELVVLSLAAWIFCRRDY